MRVEQKTEQSFVDAAVAARRDSRQEPYWWWWWTVIGGGKLPSIRWISGGGGYCGAKFVKFVKFTPSKNLQFRRILHVCVAMMR
jgi:hypothetical protein